MPLITKTEAKIILGLSLDDSSVDDQLNLLIQSVNDYVLSECDVRQFMDSRIQIFTDTISFSGKTFLDSESQFLEADFVNSLDILVDGSLHNDGVYRVTSATAGVMTADFSESDKDSFVTEAAGELITITRLVFPRSLKRTIAKMLSFDMNPKIGQGITNESIGDYSVGFSGSYPEAIVKELNNYRSLR